MEHKQEKLENHCVSKFNLYTSLSHPTAEMESGDWEYSSFISSLILP